MRAPAPVRGVSVLDMACSLPISDCVPARYDNGHDRRNGVARSLVARSVTYAARDSAVGCPLPTGSISTVQRHPPQSIGTLADMRTSGQTAGGLSSDLRASRHLELPHGMRDVGLHS